MSDNNEKQKKDFSEINLDEIKAVGFINETQLKEAIKRLKEVKLLLNEIIDIRDQSLTLPLNIKQRIDQFEQQFYTFVGYLTEDIKNEKEDVIVQKKSNYLRHIKDFYDKTFNIGDSDNNRLLEIYAFVKSYHQDSANFTKEIKDKKKEIEDNVNASTTILNELKKKTATQEVSDYATVFEKAATNHKSSAEIWLIAGIASSAVLLVAIILFSVSGILSAEIINPETGELIRYSVNNIMTKLLIISILIFFIVFSFKQFSVNRHHQSLNTHRQNALNSYKLFTQSIVGDDHNSRNVLMVQVAKAIYEHSQTTGYLNDKNHSSGPGIIELTKIIGEK